jgi:plastocyanin
MARARVISRPRALALGLAGLAIMAGSAGCGSDKKSSSSATGVTIADFSFAPETITVDTGQTVTWTNEGQADHTVKGRGFFSSKALGNGQKFSHRFAAAGRFTYLCTLHPTQMRGAVIVRG